MVLGRVNKNKYKPKNCAKKTIPVALAWIWSRLVDVNLDQRITPSVSKFKVHLYFLYHFVPVLTPYSFLS